MAKHTPGPWVITMGTSNGDTENCYAGIQQSDGDQWDIAKIWPDCESLETVKANARLIAAAPDLLRACKLVEDDVKDYREVRDNDNIERDGISVSTALRVSQAIAAADQ